MKGRKERPRKVGEGRNDQRMTHVNIHISTCGNIVYQIDRGKVNDVR